jgi:hypothetical protein
MKTGKIQIQIFNLVKINRFNLQILHQSEVIIISIFAGHQIKNNEERLCVLRFKYGEK